ncbi:MAG: pyruvate kinase, partial [Armatimonadota bacterium]
MRRTRIVCTLGPASNSRSEIMRLARAGMDVARLNFSHGTPEDHETVAERVRSVAASLGRPVA